MGMVSTILEGGEDDRGRVFIAKRMNDCVHNKISRFHSQGVHARKGVRLHVRIQDGRREERVGRVIVLERLCLPQDFAPRDRLGGRGQRGRRGDRGRVECLRGSGRWWRDEEVGAAAAVESAARGSHGRRQRQAPEASRGRIRVKERAAAERTMRRGGKHARQGFEFL